MTLTFEQRIRNVASVVHQYTKVTRPHNGRGRMPSYAVDKHTIAGAARQLAEIVLEYLDARGLDSEEPAGVVDDLPF